MIRLFLLALTLGSPLVEASANSIYVQNALSVTNSEGIQLFSNRDVECVSTNKDSASGKDNVTFTLNSIATRSFYDFTSKNIGKILNINICGGPPQSPAIMAGIPNGKILATKLSDEQWKCLRATFQFSETCKECPVCKN